MNRANNQNAVLKISEKWRNGRRGCYEKYIMFCDIDSEHFMLGASFIVGSTPTFSACERDSSDG